MTKDLVSQVKKEIEQEKIAHDKALIRKMLSLIEAKEKQIADKKAELVALKEELGGLKRDLNNGDYSEVGNYRSDRFWGEFEWVWRSNDSTFNNYIIC